jgi:hypothetical protein
MWAKLVFIGKYAIGGLFLVMVANNLASVITIKTLSKRAMENTYESEGHMKRAEIIKANADNSMMLLGDIVKDMSALNENKKIAVKLLTLHEKIIQGGDRRPD